MVKKIFNSNSIYQLLIFLLVTNKEEREHYIIGDAFPEKVKMNLDNVILVGNDMIRISSKNKIKYIYNYIRQLVTLKKFYNKKLKHIKNKEIYGATIFAPLFAKHNNVYVLEDGTGSYIKKKDLKSSPFLKAKGWMHKLFLGVPDNFHIERKPYIDKIFYTGIGEIPKDVTQKAEIINLQNLWDAKNEEEKEEILRIFNLSNKDLELLKGRKNILFTQTLNEDGFVDSEEEKIEIYRKALENFDYSSVVVKPHPREKTDYQKHFPGIYQMENQIPFQLYSLLGLKFEKVLTLFSTVALSLKDTSEIIWFGTTLSETMKNKYGEIPISKYLNEKEIQIP